MATLAVSKEFLEGFAKLEPRLRSKVAEQTDIFARLTAQQLREHKGLNLEPHTNAADPRARTIRLDRNHRGIVMDVGNDELFILMTIGTHDETDRWMAKNTFKVNAATGAFEIYNVEAVESEAEAATVEPTEGAEPLFGHRKDKDFSQLGLDVDLVPTLRAFTDEDQLTGLLGVLPQTQADVLIDLIGNETVEKIYASVIGRETTSPIDPDDVAAALTVPASRSTFRILAGQDELNEVLNQPLTHWKVFLHPSQTSLVEWDVNGPIRVTGGAGTGKTVVAIHRAKHLAAQLPAGSGKAILFTTFTRNLAQAIGQDLRTLGGTDLLDVVDVLNVDRIAYRIVQDAEDHAPKVADDQTVQRLWQQVVDDRGLDYSPGFLKTEWEQVVLAQSIDSRTDYLTASRAGRGVPLDRRSRAAVWKAIEEFTKLLADREARTHLQLADAAAGYVARRSIKPYRHVVVDEAQDLHEAQWRLLRAIVDPVANDLFIVGDSHQRIYDRRSSLSKVGIEIRGRSRKLKINYRTTHEILVWSLAALGEGDFDDLDIGTDQHDFAGYHSYRHGPAPTMSGHTRRNDQLTAMAQQVSQWIADGVQEEEIGVAARSRARSFDEIERALTNAGRQVCILPTDMPRAVGVRVGTMHRMKGLEFKRVAIVDLSDNWFPEPQALTDDNDPVQLAADMQRELCLLYVAATRARDDLWIGWSGKPSRFLGPVIEEQ